MITKIPQLKKTESYIYVTDDDLFSSSLNQVAEYTAIDSGIFYNQVRKIMEYWYSFADTDLENNLIYDVNHNGRYHFQFKGLKYYSNISDLWFMNPVLIGYNGNPSPVFGKEVAGVGIQSFANINLAVDSMYLAMKTILPAGKDLTEGMFEATEVGIRLVIFIDKLDIVERTIGTKKVKNLQFHFTIKAYLIDPSLGGQYKDFTQTALLSQKSFYYEQTVPTQVRADFTAKNSLKTGWGHFLYAATTTNNTPISYIQLSNALKTIYNSIIFSQSTDNASLQVDSLDLLKWLNANITLKNASEAYEPKSVVPNQSVPIFTFTEQNVLKNWLNAVSSEATDRGRPDVNFLMSYDNIYWEPLADLFSGDIYSNSPAIFMSRMTSYYAAPGNTPVDEPGTYESSGGYPKSRRKYFLSNLIQYVANRTYSSLSLVSPYLETNTPEKFLGPKFFPYYMFKQYKDNSTQKEMLDIVTTTYASSPTAMNVIEAETSQDLKKLVSENLNQYRKKITKKPDIIPNALGSSIVDRINSIGYVQYVKDDGTIDNIELNTTNGIARKDVFSLLTWCFMVPQKIGPAAEWTINGRYITSGKDLDSVPIAFDGSGEDWRRQSLCTIMNSGMYDTPEIAYKEYKRIINKINIFSDPTPNNPEWKDYYKCLPSTETTETTIEYCDPSPAIDSRPIVNRIAKQKVSISANGIKTNIGDPTYEYPSTALVLKNYTKVINGKDVKGERTIVYEKCVAISNPDKEFSPYPVQPTGPVIVTGPTGKVDVSLETFINPAVFNKNIITMLPSDEIIPIIVEKCYYVFEFDKDNLADSSSKYTITLSPGQKGQVLILEVNTLGTPYKGVVLNNGSNLYGNSSSQRVWLSTDTWGDGEGLPVKSYLFLLYDGKNWVEFLRRNIY